MSIPVGNIVIEMAANVARLQKDMDSAKRSVSGAMSDIKKSADMAMNALGAIGIGLSVNAFAGWIKGAIDAADSLNDLSKSTSIAVGELAGLKLAAKQSGGDLEGTAQAINKLSVNIANDVKKFASIGVTAKDPLEAFKQLADIFSAIEDPQLKAALGAEALGKSWASAAPMLAEGGAKIGEMVEKGKQLSGITPEIVAASDAFNDTLAEMSTQVGGVATQIAAKLLPSLQTISDAMNEAGQSTTSFSIAASGVKTIFDTIVVLGANVGYVLKMTGLELSGIMQQLAAAATLDFAGAAAIGEKMKADAIQARKDIDAFSEKILSTTKATTDVQDKNTKSTAGNTAAIEKNVRAFIDSNKAKAEGVDLYAKMIKQAEDILAAIKFESDAYAMSNVEKETAIALQKLVNAGVKEGTDEYIKYSEAIIAAVMDKEMTKSIVDQNKKIADEKVKTEEDAVKARLKLEEDYAQQVKDINNQIGQSLTDALMSGGMNARDFIVNMFKTMVLRPILQPVITGMVGMFTGGAASAMGEAVDGATGGSMSGSMGLMSIASNLKSAYDVVTGGFASLGATVGGAAESLGATLMLENAAGSSLSMAGESLVASAYTLGSAATVLGGVGAGLGLGSLISGDKSLIGGSSMITVGAGTAIGAGIGTMILPVVGTAIGAALGGVVGGLANQFGNAPKEVTDYGISGSLSSNGSTVQNYSEWEKQGGWFSSDKNGAEFSAVEAKVSKYINASVAGSAIAVKQYADILGLPAQGIADFTFEIKRSMDGLSPEEATKALNELLTQYGNALAASATAEIGPFIRDGEEAGATLARLASSLKTVNGIFDTLNIKLYDTSLFSADAASKLADMFGGLDNLISATNAYYQTFYSEQERTAKTAEQLARVFMELGQQMPTTNAEFRALVDAARAAGNDGLFAALIKLAPTFDGLQKSIESITSAMINAAQASAAALTNERLGLESRLLQAQSNTVELRNRELASVDETNRALLTYIYLLDDQAAQTEKINSINSERFGLETELLQAQQNTTELRNRELEALDPANRALKEWIYSIQDFASQVSLAISDSLSAISTQITVSKQASDTAKASAKNYFDLATSIKEIGKGLFSSSLNESQTLKALRATFQGDIKSANTGNADSMKVVGSSAQNYLDAYKGTATSQLDYTRQSLLVKSQLDSTAAVATALGVGADYQAKLYDANTAILEVLQDTLQSGTVTVDVMQEQLSALNAIQKAIVDSATLTVQATQTGTSEYQASLVDASGSIVGGLNSTTALQILSVGNQTSALTNSTTGQTTAFGQFTDGQIEKLSDIATLQDESKSITDIVATATNNSTIYLKSILAKLSEAKTSDTGVISQISTGNLTIASKLDLVVIAIRDQISNNQNLSAAQAASNAQIAAQQATAAAAAEQARINAANAAFNAAQQQAANIAAAQAAAAAESARIIREAQERAAAAAAAAAAEAAAAAARAAAAAQQQANTPVANPFNSYVVDTYQQYLGRTPSKGEIEYAAGMLSSGYSVEGYLYGITHSPEYLSKHADGGFYQGGLSLVGEQGPELVNFERPSMIYTASETRDILSGGSNGGDGLASELRALREENRAQSRAMVQMQARMSKMLERWDGNGIPETRVVTA